MQNLNDEIASLAAAEIAKEIDTGILYEMFKESGWTPVTLESLGSRKRAINIDLWLEENCNSKYFKYGRQFLFQDSKDALFFILAWGL